MSASTHWGAIVFREHPYRRICNGESRFARVYDWHGLAMKVYRPMPYDDGTYSSPRETLAHLLKGQRLLEQAGVPHLPILGYWFKDDVLYVIQELAREVEQKPRPWKEGQRLALLAWHAGVADIVPQDLMEHNGQLVVVDNEELRDESDYQREYMDRVWHFSQNYEEGV